MSSTTVVVPEEAQIVPTRLELTTIYIPVSAEHTIVFWATDLQSNSD